MKQLLVVAMLLISVVGCRGPRNFENENDRLRREVMELQRERDVLTEKLELRLGELESLRAAMEVDNAVPGAEPPILSQIVFGRYSGAVDTDDDDMDDRVRLYLNTLDQHGRMLPVAGRANVQVVAVREAEDPKLLAEQAIDPKAFDAAYREGFFGTHYTLEVDLPADLDVDVESVTVKVTFTHADTGRKLTAEDIFPLDLKPRPTEEEVVSEQ